MTAPGPIPDIIDENLDSWLVKGTWPKVRRVMARAMLGLPTEEEEADTRLIPSGLRMWIMLMEFGDVPNEYQWRRNRLWEGPLYVTGAKVNVQSVFNKLIVTIDSMWEEISARGKEFTTEERIDVFLEVATQLSNLKLQELEGISKMSKKLLVEYERRELTHPSLILRSLEQTQVDVNEEENA